MCRTVISPVVYGQKTWFMTLGVGDKGGFQLFSFGLWILYS